MEENQNSEQFNFTNGKKNKKKMNPIKGLLIALLIVFLMCVVGLLIRMVIADDGDYFKPIKDIFGIEGEKEEHKSSKKSKSSRKNKKDDDEDEDDEDDEENDDEFEAAERYALLSDDVNGKDVKHYRLTVDVEEFFEIFMDENENLEDELDSFYGDVMESAFEMIEEFGDLMAGEMYFDIYFEGNEIVQIVIGFDYAEYLENMYDYMLEEYGEPAEGIDNVEDFAEQVEEVFNQFLDKDLLYNLLLESGEGVEESLNQMGFKEKDFKEAFDFNNDKGLIEFYLNGTTKVRAIGSLLLDGGFFEENLKSIEEETGIKIDRDNILEGILSLANESEEYKMFGFEFEEVK